MTLMILILVANEINAYNNYQDNQTKLMKEQLDVQKNMYPKHVEFSVCYKKVFLNDVKNNILNYYSKYQRSVYKYADNMIISVNNIKNNTDVTIDRSYLKNYDRDNGIVTCDVTYSITPTGSLAKKYDLSGYTVTDTSIQLIHGYRNNKVGNMTHMNMSPVKTIARKEGKSVFVSLSQTNSGG